MTDRLRTDVEFAIVPEWILAAKVSDRAVRLYAVLSRYADREGAAHPARRTLAGDVGCSVDSVDRAIAELRLLQALEVTQRTDDAGDPTSNEYVVRRIPPEGVAAQLRLPGRTLAATGSRTGAARGSRTGAALSRATGNESQSERESGKPDATLEARELSILMAELIEGNGYKRPSTAQVEGWYLDADYMLRLDRRDPDEVEVLLRWALADSFWRRNIRSMGKLRDQYDRLRDERGQATTKRTKETAADRVRRLREEEAG